MKLLLDACVWGKAQHALAEAGHDVEWAGDWEEDPGDEEILAIKELLAGAVVTAEPGRFRVRPRTEK